MAQLIKDSSGGTSPLKLSVIEGTKVYRELREQVVDAGILKRDYSFYVRMALFAFGGFLLSAYFLYQAATIQYTILWSVILAFFGVQIGGFMHDSGHSAIFRSSKWNDIAGYISCLFVAMRYKNWKAKHNLHHAHPNQEGDTDIEIPFAFTDERYKDAKGIQGFMRRYQAYLYYPLGSILAFSMRSTGLRDYRKHYAHDSKWEILLFTIGLFIWFVLPFFLFDFTKAIVVILMTNIAMGLYLMNIFAPNHKGMPELAKGVKVSFLEHQILTARNIHGNWLNDFLYMGLNYQIEHHLFPNCPRNKLRLITPYVLALCKKNKLTYTSVGPIETNKIIISELHQIARKSK